MGGIHAILIVLCLALPALGDDSAAHTVTPQYAPEREKPIIPRFVQMTPEEAERSREAAAHLVGEHAKNFEKLFATTGYKNLAEFQHDLDICGDATVKKIREALVNENVEVRLGTPDTIRDSIAKYGILNQHQTGTSKGILAPARRNRIESRYLDTDLASYGRWHPDQKPKYAILTLGEKGKPEAEYFYGPDYYVFRLDRIRNRMTWTPGDSYNEAIYRLRDVADENNLLEKLGERPPAGTWDELFVPWDHRELIAPLASYEAANGRFEPPPAGLAPQEAICNFAKYRFRPLDSQFFEIQIFGALDLDDVSAFEFHSTPPTGDFLRELQKHHVEIRDRRPQSTSQDRGAVGN